MLVKWWTSSFAATMTVNNGLVHSSWASLNIIFSLMRISSGRATQSSTMLRAILEACTQKKQMHQWKNVRSWTKCKRKMSISHTIDPIEPTGPSSPWRHSTNLVGHSFWGYCCLVLQDLQSNWSKLGTKCCYNLKCIPSWDLASAWPMGSYTMN